MGRWITWWTVSVNIMPDPAIPHSRPTVGQAEAEAVQQVVLSGNLARRDSQYPRATAAYARDLSLPLYPSLDEVETERVIDAVCQIAQGKRN